MISRLILAAGLVAALGACTAPASGPPAMTYERASEYTRQASERYYACKAAGVGDCSLEADELAKWGTTAANLYQPPPPPPPPGSYAASEALGRLGQQFYEMGRPGLHTTPGYSPAPMMQTTQCMPWMAGGMTCTTF